MEFDNLITFILLFVFFVLPSVLKSLGKKKKPIKIKKKKTSIFGKLGDTIQKFVRELEKQALEAKQKAKAEEQGLTWEELADQDEIELDLNEEIHQPAPVQKTVPPVPEFYDPDHPFISPKKTPVPALEPVRAETHSGSCALPGIRANLPVHSLRQAVVWSEILGKPVALRDD